MPNRDIKELLTRREVERILKISRSQIYNLLRHGKLTAYKIGGDLRFQKDDINKLIKSHPYSTKKTKSTKRTSGSTKGKVQPGDSVIIIGPGTQGLASVLVADHIGAGKICLIGTSKDRKRLELGKSLGATECFVVEDEDIIKRVKEITDNEFADVVICCVGSPKAIRMALDLVKPLGTIVLVGLTGNKKSNLLTDKIVTNEIQVFGGLGQSWNVEAAIKLLESNKYPIKKMVTHSFTLKETEKALRTSAYEIAGQEPIKSIIVPD